MSLRRKLIRAKGLVERTYDLAHYTLADDQLEAAVDGLNATFSVRNFADYRRARHLSNERTQISFLLSEVSGTDVFWDVGSCVGSYACFIGQVAEETVAFEPHPGNAAVLRENISLNGLDDSVTVRETALGDREGTRTLYVSRRASGSGHHSLVDRGLNGTIEVQMTTGDGVPDLPDPDVIKIDVEGSEAEVITGARERISTGCRLLLVEVHPEADVDSVESSLLELGFEVDRNWGGVDHSFLIARAAPS